MIKNLTKPFFGLLSKTFAIIALVWLLVSNTTYANNITISNLSLTGKNTSAGVNNIANYMLVQFDINWENSWRTSAAPNNWDAAWVFIKYRVSVANGGDGLWKHATLNVTGHTAPTGSIIDIGLLDPTTTFNTSTNPGLGGFIYRNADGTGSFSKTGVQLRWNYGSNGVIDNAYVDIQVHAIEMVYVPQGVFNLGSGGTEGGAFYKYPTTTNTYAVNSEAAITVGTTANNLYYPSNGDQAGPISSTFPKGYNAFYCMKYEISQQGYVDFLNTLTRAQQDSRAATALPSGTTAVTNRYVMTNSASMNDRNGIRCDASIHTSNPINFYCDFSGNGIGGELDDGKDIACNYLSWDDLAAYLDWSGLRPMTELEFEKSCRGTLVAVANEYAWGTTNITGIPYVLSNSAANNEVIAANYSTTLGNVMYNDTKPLTTDGPLRVGIFAGTTGNTGRITAGATYYGIMEMSGNLYERTVTVGSVTGRSFTGTHGNGALNVTGDADIATWSAGIRGGSWFMYQSDLRTSCRAGAAGVFTTRHEGYGGRGVRGVAVPFVCGGTLPISHVAVTVAPVAKTVNYGTVLTTLSGANKCWITQNLGADNQALLKSDPSETAAGWYWQFNRKQGYKHDGTTRTPATAWDATNDNLSATWEAAKDPCTIELGAGWRIPTNAEWTTASFGWSGGVDAYNSDLKLHAAGLLLNTDGSLSNRGASATYWSSTQFDANTSYDYFFALGFSTMLQDIKSSGLSVRCIKD